MLSLLTPVLLASGSLAILIVAALIFAETGLLIGFFFPGDTLLFTTGILIATGHIHLPLIVVVAAIAAAAVAGDQVGYLLGRRFGPRLYSGRHRWLKADHLRKAHGFFEKYGAPAVFLARFAAVVRTFTPAVAGAASMRRSTFTFFNIVGAIAWTALMIGLGYFAGGVPFVQAHVELVAIGVDAAGLLLLGIVWLVRRRHVGRVARCDPTSARTTRHDGRMLSRLVRGSAATK